MFQTTIFHNDDSDLTLQETIEEFESFGLTLISKEFDLKWDEWTLVIQGTREQFFSWNEEEFMEDLIEVEAA